jgi:hypothetical protein
VGIDAHIDDDDYRCHSGAIGSGWSLRQSQIAVAMIEFTWCWSTIKALRGSTASHGDAPWAGEPLTQSKVLRFH